MCSYWVTNVLFRSHSEGVRLLNSRCARFELQMCPYWVIDVLPLSYSKRVLLLILWISVAHFWYTFMCIRCVSEFICVSHFWYTFIRVWMCFFWVIGVSFELQRRCAPFELFHIRVVSCMAASTRDMTRWHVPWLVQMSRDSFKCDSLPCRTQWLRWCPPAFISGMTHWHVPWLIGMCRDSLTCAVTHWHVPWLIDMCRDSLTCDVTRWHVPWLIDVWRDSLTCDMTRWRVTWLVDVWYD